MGKKSREKTERRLLDEGGSDVSNKRRSNLERVYFLIIEWGIYLALFTPLIFLRGYFFPFVTPKTIFFRIVVDVILIAYILLVLTNRKYLPKFNILTISVTVFFGILILTSFTGVNFEKSFWSTFERMTGLLTFFHLFVFFIILSSVFKERKYWERILTVSILVGVFLGLYVLLGDAASSRGGGTIGNTSFLSAYLLFDIFFAIILLFAKTGVWRIFYGATLAVLLATLFLNIEPTRGAIGAFFIGVFILIFGYMIFSRNKLLKKLAFILLVLVILGGIGISQTSFFKEKFIDIKDLPGGARKVVWSMAFESWQEKPLLGWGPENFNIPFAKYFNPELPLTFDVWYDRVHNIVLDVLVTSGILGLLSYLSIFVIAIFGLIRNCLKVVDKKNIFIPLGMITLLAVYFLQNIWVFDMISTYMMFFLILAFISFLSFSNDTVVSTTLSVNHKTSYLHLLTGVLLIITTIFTFYFGNIQPARASKYIVEGISSPLEKAIPIFQKTIKTSPMSIFEVPEQFSRKITGFTFDQKQNKEVLENGFTVSAQVLKEGLVKNPQDFRFHLILGRHYNDFYHVTRDKEKLNQAQNYLEKTIELSPKNRQVYWSLAQTRLSQGRLEEAIELMQKSIDLEPRYSKSHWYLAMTYKIIGKNDLAIEKVKDAERTGYNWKGNLGDLKKVIEIYQNLQDYENLALLYLLAIESDPGNAQFRAGLAITYANLGQFEKARQLAKEAIELNPDFALQLEEFLESLPK